MASKNPAKQTARPFYRRKLFLWPVGVILGLIIVAFLAFKLSPWPGAIVVRVAFSRNDHQTLAALERHTPSTPITVIANQQYMPGNRSAFLDVYIPELAEQTNRALPVVVWTHGGAWVSGDKTDDAPYFKQLASQGFIVASLNYTLAPAKSYPAQIIELNTAHAYLLANASRFHINPAKFLLAGDSAGAQLTSEIDAVITNPAYAKAVGVKPALQPAQLAGTILFCGIYKLQGLTQADPNLPKIISWGDDEVVWAFAGTRNSASLIIHQASPYYYVTSAFPATFISGGNGDPLTSGQSIPLANKLQGLGVSTTTLFYPANHQPSLPHEYQFNLDTADGQQALTQVIQFLRARTE
jgi:acetyl esterase/lipase